MSNPETDAENWQCSDASCLFRIHSALFILWRCLDTVAVVVDSRSVIGVIVSMMISCRYNRSDWDNRVWCVVLSYACRHHGWHWLRKDNYCMLCRLDFICNPCCCKCCIFYNEILLQEETTQ